MKLGIGIDTGGTYTDAVIYNFETREILASAKSPTTRNDLKIGILGAIDGLPQDLLTQADVVSLSTTLATNACVEDKGGRAKLIFFGGDETVLARYGKESGLPPVEEILVQESFTDFSGTAAREPDWDAFEKRIKTGFAELDGVGIVEMNAARTGAATEKKAKAIFESKYDIPVVCGHELFSERNALRRGASTLLNAGLFPVIREFLAAVKKALAERSIRPKSLVIVRSDGSLMTEEFAALHPVETLICGPAASALGCAALTDSPNSIVVDMGGTTTDIAIVQNGVPVTVTSGVSIGKWKTFVNGLYVKTFGLGGDSAVHYQGKDLYVEPYRVIPLCVAAARYPQVKENLKALEVRPHTRFLYEHYLLMRDIETGALYTDEEKAFCRALKDGPLLLSDAAAAIGKDVYTLRVERLLKDGVVQICGFTPTDAMHLRGDFTEYDAEASALGAAFIAANIGGTAEEVCDRVYDAVQKKMYINIVLAMMENKYPDYAKNGVPKDVERFIGERYEEAKTGGNALFSLVPQTKFVLVGAGAPIGVFLQDVANLLGTKAILPKNHGVANALGAVVGSVSAVCTVEVREDDDEQGEACYAVFTPDGKVQFETLDEAVAFAKQAAEAGAKTEAEKRGAKGEITVECTVKTSEAQVRGFSVYLGTLVTAHAVGTMGF